MPVAACAVGFLWQAVAANPRKTRQAIPKVRFKVFFLTRSFSLRQATAWNSGSSGRIFGRRANRRAATLASRGRHNSTPPPTRGKRCSGFTYIVTSRVVPMTQKNALPPLCPAQEPMRRPPDRPTVDPTGLDLPGVVPDPMLSEKSPMHRALPWREYASSCNSVPEVWDQIRIRPPGNPSLPEPWIALLPSVSPPLCASTFDTAPMS
jgi:hypothetical protein